MNGAGATRVLQASSRDVVAAIDEAKRLGCDTIAWTLDEPLYHAYRRAAEAGIASEGFLQVARDESAIRDHPEWMHAPQGWQWLARFPGYPVRHPAVVAPYVGLNTRRAFEYELTILTYLIRSRHWLRRVWLADIQGPPMGCGCGNPLCRSWDNAPGEKIAPPPPERPSNFFSLEFARVVRDRFPEIQVVAVLCPECERGLSVDGVEDPDGPEGTNLCLGMDPTMACTSDYWPRLLEAFRAEPGIEVGLLLMTEQLGKDHPVFGGPRAWAKRAHRTYGEDLVPCIEPEDAGEFDRCLILTDAPQHPWPQNPVGGYRGVIPPVYS